MSDQATVDKAKKIRRLPPDQLNLDLLGEYVSTGQAFDLSELCRRSHIDLNQVTRRAIECGIECINKLPGYAMTAECYRVAERRYANSSERKQWQHTVTRHRPSYHDDRLTHPEREALAKDADANRKHHVQVFVQSWAVFWDEGFLGRMIGYIDGSIIASVPYELLTEKDCFLAVSKTGMALRFVPPKFRTAVICARAVASSESAMSFTPPALREQVRWLQKHAHG